MRKIMIASTAILSFCGVASAGDWSGTVKVLAAYDYTQDSTAPELNITADVVYDRYGPQGAAWGTISYQRRAQGIYVQESIYANALCVGKFNGGNNYSIAASVVKVVGNPTPKYITFEFDVANKLWTDVQTNTEADARDTCKKQSSTTHSAFNHGYVLAE
jgi:hypothetical protein